MQFWIRHLILLLLCVVLPFSAALYFDTQREVERAETAGKARAKQAAERLSGELELRAKARGTDALALAHNVGVLPNLTVLEKTGARLEAAQVALRSLLDASVAETADGFAWYVDAEGNVQGASGEPAPTPETMRSVRGHPVFQQTQDGYALDALWSPAQPLTWVGAAPVTVDGAAAGGEAFELAERGLARARFVYC